MGCRIGIDIGAVSVTAAVVAEAGPAQRLSEADGGDCLHRLECPGPASLWISTYRRSRGRPVECATQLLDEIIAIVGSDDIDAVVVAGSGAGVIARKLGAEQINEFKALAAAAGLLQPHVPTVFEMGGETSKFLHLRRDDQTGQAGIIDYQTNGDCAAGTGSFIDQQANRLRYKVEDIGDIVAEAERSASIAGRCSVFAKSDMIHAQQKGYTPPEVLGGLCEAVARNFRSAVVRSRQIERPVILVGGLAANSAVVSAMRRVFELDASQLTVPPGFAHYVAIGAALVAKDSDSAGLKHIADLRATDDSSGSNFPRTSPLSTHRVLALRDRVEPVDLAVKPGPVDVYLGIDIGSVSTNLVLIDDDGSVVKEIYTRTQGRPIEVVSGGLLEIRDELGDKVRICGVGTTGSGRELIGQLVGADTINDEITCHKTGASFIGTKMIGRTPDTIFEIGGQDSKYISLQEGVVVDFTMNEACAAGTGSFLEERAEELDISIKGEFAELALSSSAPIRLGERCTVFMERDVNSYVQRGADKADLVAGLAFSIGYNYINRVVRGRKIGDCIFFQGGTAYNDAVAAAFSCILDKEIIVPPHNGVMGAIGAALLAREKMQRPAARPAPRSPAEMTEGVYVPVEDEAPRPAEAGAGTKFRGYETDKVDYQLREFTCKACSNACSIQEFTVEGEKTYWGDKCSDRFRKQAKTDRKPIIRDLEALRHDLLTDESDLPIHDGAPVVGIPLCMYTYDLLRFYRVLLANMGFRTVLSDPTNRKIISSGVEAAVAEPCFPIMVAHGHVANLLEKKPDYLLLPSVLNADTPQTERESHVCPWGQTLPWVVRRSPAFADCDQSKWLMPVLRFRQGRTGLRQGLLPMAEQLGVKAKLLDRALDKAIAARLAFREALWQAGDEAIGALAKDQTAGIVLIGRPYNVHDVGVNLSVARKMREYYGVNVIPFDFIRDDDRVVTDINDNMFWNYGRKILAIAKVVGEHDNLHIVYITNFKCGPDSFIKHFVRTASGKPFLTLQFDGHSNDAGMMTRCEAYLDSKGILRPWQPTAEQATV